MLILDKINQLESRKLEFKKQLPKSSVLLKTVTAFANGAGGDLIIGVTDSKRQIVGVEDPLYLEEQIVNTIHDGIYPPLSPYCAVMTIQGKSILSVSVLPGNNKPYFIKAKGIDDGVFIRVGSTTRKAGIEQIQELKRRTSGFSYVDEIDFQHQKDSLDQKGLEDFFSMSGLGEVSDDVLTKINILRRNNGDVLPTVAGMLLFGHPDLVAYEYAAIRLSRFAGTTLQNLLESREYKIPILQLIEPLCRDILAFLPKESFYEGARRIEQPVVPFFAVREVLVNAIVHRDYSIRGSSIKINLFDDRLEIISPGVLVGNLDISDLGKGLSEIRNRTLVRIFRQSGFMEELGTGIARIIDLYQQYHLKSPVFMEQGQFFKAILPLEKR